jgi:hypothetical protein
MAIHSKQERLIILHNAVYENYKQNFNYKKKNKNKQEARKMILEENKNTNTYKYIYDFFKNKSTSKNKGLKLLYTNVRTKFPVAVPLLEAI